MAEDFPKCNLDTDEPLVPNVEFTKASITIKPEFLRIREIAQAPLPTCLIECKNWDDFCQLLQERTSGLTSRTSPTMPICVSTGNRRFTAIAGLIYPTLLSWRFDEWQSDDITSKIQFLKDCGYAVVNGELILRS